MRVLAIALLVLTGFSGTSDPALAQQKDSCKQCSEQQRACMKNYARANLQDGVSNLHEILRQEVARQARE